jgi:hypothetical protein
MSQNRKPNWFDDLNDVAIGSSAICENQLAKEVP